MLSDKQLKLCILGGQTATGKTDTLLHLNKDFPSLFEAVIADSRQIYQELTIGTGKDIQSDAMFKQVHSMTIGQQAYSIGFYEGKSGAFWLYDVAKPRQPFASAVYRKLALYAISKIRNKHRIPVLSGGTGLYIKAVTHPPATVHIPQNQLLRQQLEKLSVKELQLKLKTSNSTKLNQMNHSDKNNPRRLMRAIEVASATAVNTQGNNHAEFDTFAVYLTAPKTYLLNKIAHRIKKRLAQGMIDEVSTLLKKYPEFLSTQAGHTPGYQEIADYLKGEISLHDAEEQWLTKEVQYAKRQETWFKKQPGFRRFDITAPSWYATLVTQLKEWLYASPSL